MDVMAENVVKGNTQALCAACSRGPINIDGHPRLMVEAVGSVQMSFRCEECRTLWSRTQKRGGDFSWVTLSERTAQSLEQGVCVPPRTSPAPTFTWRVPSRT